MIGRMASRIAWRRFLSRNAYSWWELDEFPRLSPDRQRRTLAGRLLAQIQYFGARGDALPEWREAARVTDPEELWRLWPSLPVMDKSLLQSRFEPEEIKRRFGLGGTIRSTGGSTGEPTHVLHDEGMALATNTASVYTRIRMGWRPGMATVIVWGSERDIGKKTSFRSRLYVRLLRDIVIDGYELDGKTVDLALQLIRKHRPVALQGFSSMLAFVAKTALERGAELPAGSVKVAWNGGEMLYREQSDVFQQAFHVPILNRYGGRELSVMACQYDPQGPLHVLRPWLFLEVVDKSGRPVGPGESGRLLWTSTVCRGTPLLRYDIGDLGSFGGSHETEAGISQLSGLDGRFAGLLNLPNGKTINCIYWNHLFKEFPEVRQFQVVLQEHGKLSIRLQGSGMAESRDASLRQTLRDFIGNMPLTISWVERIPLTPRGKLIQVVSERGGAAVASECRQAAERL